MRKKPVFTFSFSFVVSGRIYLERRFHLFSMKGSIFQTEWNDCKTCNNKIFLSLLFSTFASFLFIVLENGSNKLPRLQFVPSAKDCCSMNTPSGIISLYFYVSSIPLPCTLMPLCLTKTDITYILMHKKRLNECLYDIGFQFVVYITK